MSACAFLGVYLIIAELKRRKQVKRLLEHGRLVKAKIEDIRVFAGRGAMNGFIIATHEGQEFRSEYLTSKHYRAANRAEYVDVYVDKLNPNIYFVDLNSL